MARNAGQRREGCSGTDLVAGDVVKVSLTPGADGSYTANYVVLSD